jgi:uncharacterized protein (DUF983 family)
MTTPSFTTLLSRALRLRCPRCGGGRLFANWFRMYPHCSNCKLRYERAPGYFLGSAYINYGLTAFILTTAYVGLHFAAGYDNRVVVGPLAVFCVIFPLYFFRYARSLWLSMDCYFDTTDFEQPEEWGG